MKAPHRSACEKMRAALETASPGKVLIHAGRIKTASTFLQVSLMSNADALADQGWLFSRELFHLGAFQSDGRGTRTAGHAALVHLGAGRPLDAGLLRGFDAELKRHRGSNLLFSAEVLGRDPRDRHLAALRPVFDGFNVELVMYLRRPSAWIQSYYIEQVTGGSMRLHVPFRERFSDLMAAAHVVPFVEQCLSWANPPRIVLRNYDLACQAPGGILSDFATTVGLVDVTVPERVDINPSPSPRMAEVVRLFNGLTTGVRGEDFHDLYKGVLERLTPLDDHAKGSIFEADQAEETDARWARENRRLVDDGHMSEADFEALVSPEAAPHRRVPPDALDARLFVEMCAYLKEAGVTGFHARPTVRGVGRELWNRMQAGLLRRLR